MVSCGYYMYSLNSSQKAKDFLGRSVGISLAVDVLDNEKYFRPCSISLKVSSDAQRRKDTLVLQHHPDIMKYVII